jgi:signal transduction histidine kinase
VVAGFALSFLFNAAETRRFDQALAEDADTLLAGVSLDDNGNVVAPALTDARALLAYSGKYWELAELRDDGRLHALQPSRSLWDTVMPTPSDLPAQLERSGAKPVFYFASGPLKQRLRVCALQARLPGRDAPVVILTAEDQAPLSRDEQRFAIVTAVALVLFGVVLVTAVVLQVRIGLRPLFAMRRDVARVRQGGAGRLRGAYPPELAPLANELNALLDHNQEVVERQRTHVGNLAHALKTPISVMLAEAESRPGELSEVVSRQAGLMRDHVEHHLRRARAAARSPGAGERTPVGPVLDELARTLDRIFGRRGVDIDCDCDTDLVFLGERQDLQEMAGNLLENACKYSHGQVQAAVAPAGPGWLVFTVEDDGPGLAPDQRKAAMRRGQRLDESAPGSGLGLSIVDELARAYGGGLTLGVSATLGGLKVELRLPRAEP